MSDMENIEQQVDQIFAEWDHTVTPGCALAVVKDGETIYTRGYGMANLEYGVPITPQTIFHIASISKHFAALAITLLAHEGKLSLDDDVRPYVPELPDFGEKITIRHLIHHTSGLRDQWELLISAGWRMDDVITMDDILELVSKQQELNFKPGDNHIYCNTGYTLISFIVQRVSEMSMREFCEERLFKPLGMKNTHFHDDHTMVVPNRAYSYAPIGYNKYKNEVLSYANVGATSLFTTVEDLALWDREFYEGKVFGKEVIDEMHTLGKLNSGDLLEYAYGLRIAEHKGLKIVEHGGADAGYRSQLLRFPDQKFSVIVFSNLGTVSPGVLARKVADLYLAEQFADDEKEVPVVELPREKLERFAGLYYSTKDQSVNRLEIREDALYYAVGPGLELEAIGEEELRVKLYPEAVFKIVNVDGVLQMQVGSGGYGQTTLYDKVDAPEPSPDEMEQFSGSYISTELDSRFNFLVEDEKLVLQRRKYGKMPLKPTIRDGFVTADFPINIFFQRNEQGEVEGFKLSTGRVKGLRFTRV